jgi:hypothetical protein
VWTKTIRLRLAIVFASIGIVAASVLLTAQAPVLVARYTATTSNVSGAGDAIRVELLKWSTDADRDQLLNAWLHPAPPAPVVAQAAPPAAGGGGGRGGGGRGGAAPPATPPPANGDAPPAATAAPRGAGGGRGGGARGGNPPAADAVPPAAGDGAAAPPLPAAAGAAAGGRGGRGGGAAPAAPAEVIPETPESSLAAALQKLPSVGILWTSESAGYSIKYAYRIPSPEGGERIIFATDRRLGIWSEQWWKPTGTASPTNLPFTVFEFRLNDKGEGDGRSTLTGKVVEDAVAKSIAVGNYAEQPIVFKGVKKVR